MLWLLAAALLLSEEEGIRRVRAHLLIENPKSALIEVEKLKEQYPESIETHKMAIEAYAANGLEEQALDLWQPELFSDRHLLEELSWGVLKKGITSTQHGVRLASMIGIYLTQDVRAIPLLIKMMRDSNAVIRSIAVQMASAYRDAPLKDEVSRMIQEEKVWMVRLQVIRSAGALKIKPLTSILQGIVQSEKTTLEERQVAIEALLEMYEAISVPEFQTLARSSRAGLRHLACCAAAHFKMEGAKDEVLRLIQDTNPAVKMAALNAFGLFYREKVSAKEAKEILALPLKDPDPAVAITASWAAFLVEPKWGQEQMGKWLKDSLPESRRFAAAALAATGNRGVALALQTLKESQDPYVKANVALGLLGQRVEVKACSDFIVQFLANEKRMWMMDKKPNPLFEILAPSQVRHSDQIPNYPEAQDQMTRLHLVSMLALVEDPRASDALKTFLKRKTWGITGVAAATLLHEGDENSLEVVRGLLHDPDEGVRLQACLVLAMLGKDETVLKELEGAYATADHERKLHILEAMGRVGHADSYPFLVEALKEPFPILRVAAAAALIQSVNR
jgi:HEAT repeat protein